MTKRRKSSFAEIVREGKAAPKPPPPPDPMFVDRDGRQYQEASSDLTPDRARELAASGALAAWDSCGCGHGRCGYKWLDRAVVARMAASGVPDYRDAGRISHWTAGDGTVLLLVWGDVRWGKWLA